jgi:hypothetical protein
MTILMIGTKVKFDTRHGSVGDGVVVGYGRSRGTKTFKIQANPDAKIADYDRWPLSNGGFYDRLSDVGLFGGEITI